MTACAAPAPHKGDGADMRNAMQSLRRMMMGPEEVKGFTVIEYLSRTRRGGRSGGR